MKKFLQLTCLNANDPLPMLGQLVRPALKKTPAQIQKEQFTAFREVNFDEYVGKTIKDFHAVSVEVDKIKTSTYGGNIHLILETLDKRYFQLKQSFPEVVLDQNDRLNYFKKKLSDAQFESEQFKQWIKDHPLVPDQSEKALKPFVWSSTTDAQFMRRVSRDAVRGKRSPGTLENGSLRSNDALQQYLIDNGIGKPCSETKPVNFRVKETFPGHEDPHNAKYPKLVNSNLCNEIVLPDEHNQIAQALKSPHCGGSIASDVSSLKSRIERSVTTALMFKQYWVAVKEGFDGSINEWITLSLNKSSGI